MKTLTIRNVPEDLHEALQRERSRRGSSLNQTVVDLLRQRLGVGMTRSNGLGKLAGGWTDEEFANSTRPSSRSSGSMRTCGGESLTPGYLRVQPLPAGDADVARLIDEAEWIGVPAVVLGELRVGFRLGAQAERNEMLLSEFIANPAVQVLPVDSDVSHQYADIAIELRRAGTPIPTNDMWIAATAAGAGAIVLTMDAHFSAVGRVGSVVLSDALSS